MVVSSFPIQPQVGLQQSQYLEVVQVPSKPFSISWISGWRSTIAAAPVFRQKN